MKSRLRPVSIVSLLLWLNAGCAPRAEDAALVPACGTVIYRGTPLVHATVVFLPEKGALAHSVTDSEGRFNLSTGTLTGVAPGTARIAISVTAPREAILSRERKVTIPQTPQEYSAGLKRAAEVQAAIARCKDSDLRPKSSLPDKYASPASSGLQLTITRGGPNDFTINLSD